MKKSINEIARNIGMQNQYLAHAVWDKKVIGDIPSSGSYHSNNAWVEIDSVKEYLKWKYENAVISKESYEKYMIFLNSLSE